MSLWSRVSPLLWEEAEVSPAAPPPLNAAEGAPGYLHKAVRFTAVGFSAVLLAAQVTGIRLTAPVDADPSCCIRPSQACKDACPPTGTAHAQCVQACDDQRK